MSVGLWVLIMRYFYFFVDTSVILRPTENFLKTIVYVVKKEQYFPSCTNF